jgi:hypothetical protein
MIVKADETGTVNAFQTLLEEVSADARVKSLFILSCDENEFSPESANDLLEKLSIPVFGGVFPQIIYGEKKLSKGVIVAGLTKKT